MAERTQKSKVNNERDTKTTSSNPPPTPTAEATEAVTDTGSKLRDELDDLLDEIDEVLETNAEDFVKSYVQKGGE